MPMLNPADFDDFLVNSPEAIGQDYLWRKSASCPCFNPLSGAANPKCKVCLGKGRIWAAAVPAKAGMMQQTGIKKFAQFGQFEIGDATLTIPQASPMYEAGQFDRITMLNSSERFSINLTRGIDRIYRSVILVDRVFWIVNDAIVEGGIPTVAADGTLSWTSGAPPSGMQYSIAGDSRDDYFVWLDLVSDRGEHFGARLPKKVVLRKFDLFNR